MGQSYDSKESLFGWIGHLPVVAFPLKKIKKKIFLNEKLAL
jgi:hypothetical protein